MKTKPLFEKYDHVSSFVTRMFFIHSLVYNISFKTPMKILSSLLSLLLDAYFVYYMISAWLDIKGFHEVTLKRVGSATCIYFCVVSFRVWFHIKGKDLITVITTISNIYPTCLKYTKVDVKKGIYLYIIQTVYVALLTFVCFYNTNFIGKVGIVKTAFGIKSGDNWLLNFLVTLFYINIIWFSVILPSVFSIYFCMICSLFKQILKSFTKRLEIEFKKDIKVTLRLYSVLTDSVFLMSDILNTPSVIICALMVFNSFYAIYRSMYDGAPQAILIVVGSFWSFSLIGISSSNVYASYEAMREKFHALLVKRKNLRKLALILRTFEEDSVGFVILDSIAVNRWLVISTFGTIMTYTIMIANLGRTPNPSSTQMIANGTQN